MRLIIAVLGLVAEFCLLSPALAQDDPSRNYPSRTIRLVLGFAPGGSTDLMARLASKHLAESFGQPAIVENRPGALAIAATEYVARAVPDGYTLLVTSSGPMTTNAAMRANLPYSPLRDFAPITMLGKVPYLLVVSVSIPVTSVKELVQYAKARPKGVTYSASGSTFQLATELFKQKTGTQFLHIPYKSGGDAVNALVSGEVTMGILDSVPIAGMLKAGKLRALAITDSARSQSFPNVPTFAEMGFEGMEVYGWVGVVAPAGTPMAVVRKLQNELVRMVKLPEVRERFRGMGVEPVGNTAEELRRMIAEESERWAAVAKAANIVAQ